MKFCKVGFHAGTGGGVTGIMEHYVTPLNKRGIPAVVLSANNAGLVREVVLSGERWGVENVVLFRVVGGISDDNPPYNEFPLASADFHYNANIKSVLLASPELEEVKGKFYIVVLNEPDKNRWGIVCQWAIRLTERILATGHNVAVIGCNAGEPEPEHWGCPEALELLRLLEDTKGRAALAVHEGKAGMDIMTPVEELTPFLVGRYQDVFATCDAYGIAHPDVFITEWAWAYNDMPGRSKAMTDVRKLAAYYDQHPEVKGICLWNLNAGSQWGKLPRKLNRRLLVPSDPDDEMGLLGQFAVEHFDPDYAPPEPEPELEPEPPESKLRIEHDPEQRIIYITYPPGLPVEFEEVDSGN